MRCAACSSKVGQAIRALEGVEAVAVNLATARASVEWDSRRLTLNRILDSVSAAGFRPRTLCGEQGMAARTAERRAALKRIGVAGLGMMQTMMFVYALYAGGAHGIDPGIAQYLRLTGMLFATAVLAYSGAPFLLGAWRDLRSRTLGMDVPVALALVLAYGASAFNTLRGAGEIYFDSVTMFIFFLSAGRFLEMVVRQRSLSATEALGRSLPVRVMRINADGGRESVALESIAAGDLLSVAKGAVVPVDATLARGRALLDESLITGESAPIPKHLGQRLLGGSVNRGEAIEVLALGGSADSMLASIVRLLERAQAQRPPIAKAADRAAAVFVCVTLALATLVAVLWLLVDPARALPATLAVLVVTCPCALSLATPAAIAAATTRLARAGLLVTRSDALERLAKVDSVMIDKTGTLTRGTGTAEIAWIRAGLTPERVLALAGALERASDHPLAAMFETATAIPDVEDAAEFAGRGVQGRIEGRLWRLGAMDFVLEVQDRDRASAVGEGFGAPFTDSRIPTPQDLVLGGSEGLVATFAVRDIVEPRAAHAIAELRHLGLEVAIASGDTEEAVSRVAHLLGIARHHARMSPERKLELLRKIQASGERVLMIGDGINDGPVLAAAHVSCAMGQGSAIAQAASDLLLLNDSLGAVATGVSTGRRTLAVMRQNLIWALCYNLAAVPLAALGWIAPWVAAIGMSLSSLAVVLNSARLAWADGRGLKVGPSSPRAESPAGGFRQSDDRTRS
jgi:Cu2+-exporting ATPase